MWMGGGTREGLGQGGTNRERAAREMGEGKGCAGEWERKRGKRRGCERERRKICGRGEKSA